MAGVSAMRRAMWVTVGASNGGASRPSTRMHHGEPCGSWQAPHEGGHWQHCDQINPEAKRQFAPRANCVAQNRLYRLCIVGGTSHAREDCEINHEIGGIGDIGGLRRAVHQMVWGWGTHALPQHKTSSGQLTCRGSWIVI